MSRTTKTTKTTSIRLPSFSVTNVKDWCRRKPVDLLELVFAKFGYEHDEQFRGKNKKKRNWHLLDNSSSSPSSSPSEASFSSSSSSFSSSSFPQESLPSSCSDPPCLSKVLRKYETSCCCVNDILDGLNEAFFLFASFKPVLQAVSEWAKITETLPKKKKPFSSLLERFREERSKKAFASVDDFIKCRKEYWRMSRSKKREGDNKNFDNDHFSPYISFVMRRLSAIYYKLCARYGVNAEKAYLDEHDQHFQDLVDMSHLDSSRMVHMSDFNDPHPHLGPCTWRIRMQADGLTKARTIVEVKHRVRSIRPDISFRDRLQVQLYMWMTGSTSGMLVQCKRQSRDKYFAYSCPVPYQEDFVLEVLQYFTQIVRIAQKIIGDSVLATAYASMERSSKERFLATYIRPFS